MNRLMEPGSTRKPPSSESFFNFARKPIMNRTHLTAITLALTALTAGNVLAADAQTPNTGNIIASHEAVTQAKEQLPNSTLVAQASHGKTRAQVQAELLEAVRTGDIIGNYETGAKLNEMFPGGYPK